ncbi:unnamed protein product [Spirodela intermedia]|uniref:Uncharacterized protein n=1 Tax=Spirodela intermedia TaxID=51605 RepID=A0A7I8K3H3_SPIIN|nr:unnamed protein product [Spirodela intermedia]
MPPNAHRMSLQTTPEGHPGQSNPRFPLNEAADGEGAGLTGLLQHMKPAPVDPAGGGAAVTRVHVLAVVECVESEVAAPLRPPLGVYQPVELRLHEDHPRVLLPWPPQEAGEGLLRSLEVRRRQHAGPVDGGAGGLVGGAPSLRCDHVGLVPQWPPHVDVAVLKDGGSVAEDEVDGTVDVAVAVELPLGVREEGVLVAPEAATVEDSEVRRRAQCHRLVLPRPGGIFECHVSRPEPIAGDACAAEEVRPLAITGCFFVPTLPGREKAIFFLPKVDEL